MAAAAAVLLGAGGAAEARASEPTKAVSYRGYVIRVPRTWPVYDLRRSPTVCVRFDRHALYVGTPGSDQRCPAHATGRTEAILIEPLQSGIQGTQSSAPTFALPRQRLLVSVTWANNPGLVERALRLRSLRGLRAPRLPHVARRPATARPAQASGGVYTGLGFDACSAPSSSTLSAWGSSPYRAVGVYIGGANRACSQPNLTSSWVSAETSAGWHLIPIFVGRQAPTNSCGCQGIIPSQAQAEGTAAANNAVAAAQSLGIGAGNPIYFDMEAYNRGGTNTSAVLAFLSAWTAQLHADSYISGVYSSGTSGIRDLVAQVGAGYLEPDDLWIADWNGQQTTSDPFVPSSDWSSHERLHQYQGGHNETHGSVTLNIDGDYLDGATAGGGETSSLPVNTAPPSIGGATRFGQTLSASTGAWSGTAPISFAYQWQLCTSRCANVAHATRASFTAGAGAIGMRLRVIVTASNGAGKTKATSSEVGPVAPTGYWLFTASGSVYGSVGTRWFGSPSFRRVRQPAIVGLAATPNGGGYWVAGSSGQVWSFGDAAHVRWEVRRQPVAGIVADPAGGYWLFTAGGNVHAAGGARWFGSRPGRRGLRPAIVGMAATPDGGGYWMADSSGQVWAFGDAAHLRWQRRRQPVAGIVADPTGGYWLFTASGGVYTTGARRFGSPASRGARGEAIVGMAATPDGRGYWLVRSSGQVSAFGDAARVPRVHNSHPIVGIAGP